jgi:heme-degrading monooxygenase HmoA
VLVETLELRLAPGADTAAFLDADRRVQTELVPNQPGFLRRTTARGADGWLVITLWRDEADADAFAALAERSDVHREFVAFADALSVVRKRYTTLD